MIHEPHDALYCGGVLFLIPALISQGLFRCNNIYEYDSKFYYSLESILLTMALLALCRIKNIEQTKNIRSGELGRLIGMDRIPEKKCLRGKIKLLSEQNKSEQWNESLMKLWKQTQLDQVEREGEMVLYIDGHVQIYNGYAATLPAKYISRQKLCMSALSEFWLHGDDGLPYMVVQGELNEKLQEIILEKMIPQLIVTGYIKTIEDPLTYPQVPQCTLVFDREAYEYNFFEQLWNKHRVAIITYRKFVKDKWDEKDFAPYEIVENIEKSTTYLCEKEFIPENYSFREVRKLCANTHQTAILTTHPTMKVPFIAKYMFNRWTQENFFKYMISDYNLDQIVEYGIEGIDENMRVVNPMYKKYQYQLKKIREKIARRKARLYNLQNQNKELTIDQQKKVDVKIADLLLEIEQMTNEERKLLKLRSEQPYHIKLKDMPPEKQYNKLKTESKLLTNIIKMICYRAESSVANILNETLRSKKDEKRMLVKQIIQTPADIRPDFNEKTLTVSLHSLTSQRYNEALEKLIETLNDSCSIFPGTELRLIFKSTAINFT